MSRESPKVEIRIVRSKRKTLSLSLGEGGEAVVRAPKRASDAEIERFVFRHRRWLERRLAEREQTKISFDDGATLTLFGKDYTVADGRAAIEGDILYLPRINRASALVEFCKRLAAETLGEMTENMAKRYGFSYASVRISRAGSRWGSCNRNKVLSYTFRLAFVPIPLCEYVVAHELCHTRVFNHGAAFWQEVARILPDWRERRKTLRAQGGVMCLFKENPV